MSRGLSLHIGLNAVDPHHYAGWSGPLNACEADARDMKAIAQSQGFQASLLLTAQATRAAVLDGIAQAAGQLAAGDIFLLTMSSHGGQVPDLNEDEPDGLDETWCLFDGELIDDELSLALTDFTAAVRVLVISDSCHSGTITKSTEMLAIHGDLLALQHRLASAATQLGGKAVADILATISAASIPRVMPLDVMSSAYLAQKEMYDKLGAREELKTADQRIKASVILLAGCQDNQLSMDGAFNGAFTGALKTVWNGGAFNRNYADFVTTIRAAINRPTQSPALFRLGPSDPAFDAQHPFTI